jgi:hypothetical protein
MLNFKTTADARAAGLIVTPYRSRTTNSLLFTAKLLAQRDMPIPTDLSAALNERGIEVSSL